MTPNAERVGPPAAELARMLVTLFWVVAATLVLLAGLGALPRWLAGEERGPVLAGSVPEAERRLGSSLFLPAYFPDRLAWPPGEVRVSGGPGGSARLVLRPREAVGSPVVLLQSGTYRKCPHCKGTGTCRQCHGTGRLGLQKGKQCTACFPHGSGKCANCRGLGGFDEAGHPAAPPEQAQQQPADENP